MDYWEFRLISERNRVTNNWNFRYLMVNNLCKEKVPSSENHSKPQDYLISLGRVQATMRVDTLIFFSLEAIITWPFKIWVYL